MGYVDRLREDFITILTTDSVPQDRRRKGFHQAIFDPDTGRACWTRTELDDVLDAFDLAVRRNPMKETG